MLGVKIKVKSCAHWGTVATMWLLQGAHQGGQGLFQGSWGGAGQQREGSSSETVRCCGLLGLPGTCTG